MQKGLRPGRRIGTMEKKGALPLKLLISACLLGCCCRYDGASKPQPWVEELAQKHTLIPVCPEQMGGLPTPRTPSERVGDRVLMWDGTDVTAQYRRGAEEALRLYGLFGCEAALLKARSPSCGLGAIYDGSFSGTLIPGDGVTAELLKAHGIPVFTEENMGELI